MGGVGAEGVQGPAEDSGGGIVASKDKDFEVGENGFDKKGGGCEELGGRGVTGFGAEGLGGEIDDCFSRGGFGRIESGENARHEEIAYDTVIAPELPPSDGV